MSNQKKDTLSLTPRMKYMSIYPLANPERLDFTGTSCSDVMQALGAWQPAAQMPLTLTRDHLDALRAIVAVTKLDCWRQLLSAVERHGKVEIHLED